MFSKSLVAGLFLIGLGLAIYVLYGSQIVAHFASAGGQSSDVELNLREELLTQLGVVQDNRLTEISGIDASIMNPGAYWVHNDSGHPADVYLISETGETLMRVSLSEARNIDWEDITVFEYKGKAKIAIGDVGDNNRQRDSCSVYLFDEPVYQPQPLDSGEPVEISVDSVKHLKFTYEDGPHNCEAIAYDKRKHSILLIEKAGNKAEREAPGVYQLRFNRKKWQILWGEARRIADVKDPMVTAADISTDAQFLMCNYALGHYIHSPLVLDWASLINSGKFQSLALPVQRQREAICFSHDNKAAIVVSEFGKQPIWKVQIQQLLSDKKN